MAMGDDCPEILEPAGLELEDLERVIAGCHCMIAVIMTDYVDGKAIAEADFYIKYFLTAFAKIDKSLNPGKRPQYISPYNFPSLLNLPAQMRNYGAQRNMWDGGIRAEGFINFSGAKSHQANIGYRKGWQSQTMNRMHRSKSMKFIYGIWRLKMKGRTMKSWLKICSLIAKHFSDTE